MPAESIVMKVAIGLSAWLLQKIKGESLLRCRDQAIKPKLLFVSVDAPGRCLLGSGRFESTLLIVRAFEECSQGPETSGPDT